MATLSDVRSNVADMLRGRTDLNSQITAEIGNAILHYSRRANWLTERRGGTIATVAGTTWYSSIDNSASAGFSDSASGTAPTATDSTKDIVSLIFAKLEQGTTDWPLTLVSYREFERLLENSSTQGTPSFITYAQGRIGLWPTPGAVYSCYISAFFKPTVPTGDTDESAFFDEWRELIELSAARRVASKWLQDEEMTRAFYAAEGEQEALLMAEGVARRTTGRLTPRE